MMKPASWMVSMALLTICMEVHAAPVLAQSTSHYSSSNIRDYVQKFLSWYVPLAQREGGTPSWIIAINRRSGFFDKSLVSALKINFSRASKGQADALDFDPFLGGQDVGKRYDICNIYHRGEVYYISVCSKNAHIGVIIEFRKLGNSLVLFDVYYDKTSSLRKILNIK